MKISAFRDVLSHRNYALYAAGNTVSLIGTWIQIIAFGWATWELTRSPLSLGIVAAAGIIPTLAGGIWGGILADRMDRLQLTLWAQAASFVLSITVFALYQTGNLGLIHIVTIKALLSGVTAMAQPARTALISRLVLPHQLGTAISFASLTFNLARFIGPALAGLIIATYGVGITFLANAATFAFMGVMIAMMRLPAGITRPEKQALSPKGGPKPIGALQYISSTHGPLVLFVLLGLLTIGVRPVSEFFPALASQQFDLGIEAVATLTSCLAAGSILGGLWTAGRPIEGQARTTLVSASLYILTIMVFLHTRTLLQGAAILVLSGVFTSIFAISAQTLIQAGTPDGFKGRILGFWFIVTRAGPELGALLIGASALGIGLHYSLLIACALCLCVSLATWALHDRISHDLESTNKATSQTN